MVLHVAHTATLTGYFGSSGYEKEDQEVKKKLPKFIQTGRCNDKESKFRVATRAKYVIISLINQD